MFFKFLQPILAPDTGNGGGYYIDPEQVEGLTLDDEDTTEAIEQNVETDDEVVEETHSEEETGEGDPGEETEPTLFDIDGEQVDLETIKQWKQGNMRQEDYTRKTQEASELRKQAEQLKQQFEQEFQPYRQLDQLLQQNPQKQQEFVQFLQGMQQNQAQNNPQQAMMNNPMVQQMQEQMQQMQRQMEEQNWAKQVEQEKSELFNSFPDAKDNFDKIAEFVDNYNEKNKTNLNLIDGYKLMNFENVKKQTQQEMVKNNMKKKPANTVKPKNNTKTSNEKVIPDGGYDDLVAHLMKQNINL